MPTSLHKLSSIETSGIFSIVVAFDNFMILWFVVSFMSFLQYRLRAAKKIETETGQVSETDIAKAVTDDANESLTEVLHKAGRHMEDTIGEYFILIYTVCRVVCSLLMY